MSDTSAEIQRVRKRLNRMLLLLPQQWITLAMIYWTQRLLRPAELIAGEAPVVMLAGAWVVAAVPALLPATYFRPRRWERLWYPRLGLSVFRALAPDGQWVNRRLRQIDPAYRVVHDAESLARHLKRSIVNERWHLSWLMFGAMTQAAAVVRGQWMWATVLSVLNVVFNLYPVLHQRHVRARARRSVVER